MAGSVPAPGAPVKASPAPLLTPGAVVGAAAPDGARRDGTAHGPGSARAVAARGDDAALQGTRYALDTVESEDLDFQLSLSSGRAALALHAGDAQGAL